MHIGGRRARCKSQNIITISRQYTGIAATILDFDMQIFRIFGSVLMFPVIAVYAVIAVFRMLKNDPFKDLEPAKVNAAVKISTTEASDDQHEAIMARARFSGCRRLVDLVYKDTGRRTRIPVQRWCGARLWLNGLRCTLGA